MPKQSRTDHVLSLPPIRFFRDLSLHWLTFGAALFFYILTVGYAWHPEIVSRHAWIGGSPARALKILSILSGIANPMLATTIGNSLDTLRDSLVARDKGHYLLDNQILQAGTGIATLFGMAIGQHVPRKRTRLWSAFRLLCMVVVPALGILIFSKFFYGFTYPYILWEVNVVMILQKLLISNMRHFFYYKLTVLR